MVAEQDSTVVLYADPGCPWAHLAVHRFHEHRRALGLSSRVFLDVRPFPLEIVNEQPTPKLILDAEIPVVGALEPDAGWQMWQGDGAGYPVTMLPAMEAVEAAKRQGLPASEALDFGLRHAFFAESRCISLVTEIVDVARCCSRIDEDMLMEDLASGSARAALSEHIEEARKNGVEGSPHFFLPDGTSVHNPGIESEWTGPHGEGFPVVKSDDPSTYDDLLLSAAGQAQEVPHG